MIVSGIVKPLHNITLVTHLPCYCAVASNTITVCMNTFKPTRYAVIKRLLVIIRT